MPLEQVYLYKLCVPLKTLRIQFCYWEYEGEKNTRRGGVELC